MAKKADGKAVASSLRLEKSAHSADTTQHLAFVDIILLSVREILDEEVARKLVQTSHAPYEPELDT